jgi:diguanylate cyclase (GGDEF)-like protein
MSKKKKKQVRVKIFSKEDKLDHYYQIRISKLNSGNNYSLSFTDITELEFNRLKIMKTAEYDPLTKIYNRVKVNDVFEKLAYNAKKHNYDLTLILFDIDHFKRVNDDYGHNAGDSVLKELATLVKGLLRQGDIFARWGGEEFVVLLQNTSVQESTRLASRLRHEIESFHFEVVKNITCSFGVTKFRAGDTRTMFFERVDVALYEAKDRGRNQVITK